MTDSEKPKIEETKAEDETPKVEEKPQVEEKTYEADEDTKKAFSQIATALTGINESLKALHENQQKAMEEPTDLPAQPKSSDSEDIGDEVKVPAKPYVSNSEQASLHDDQSGDNKPESDKDGLSMQEKTHTIDNSVRPGQAGVGINKSLSPNGVVEEKVDNPILKAFRTKGFQNAELIAKDIHARKYDYIAKDDAHVWSPGVGDQ